MPAAGPSEPPGRARGQRGPPGPLPSPEPHLDPDLPTPVSLKPLPAPCPSWRLRLLPRLHPARQFAGPPPAVTLPLLDSAPGGPDQRPLQEPPDWEAAMRTQPTLPRAEPAWMGHGAHRLPGTLDVRPHAWGRRDPQECPFRGDMAPVPAACIAKCRSTFPGRLPAGAGLPLGVVSGSPGPRGARPLGWHVPSTTLCPGTCPRHLWAAPGLAAARWSGLWYGRRPLASALPASPCRGRDGAPGAAVSKPAGPGRPARGRPGRRAGDRGLPAPAITERPGRRAPRDPPRPLHLLLSTSRDSQSSVAPHVFPGHRREAFPGP